MTQPEGTQIAVLRNDMNQVKSDIQDLKTTQKAGFDSLEQKLDALDKKFAGKWTEKFAIVIITAIVLFFLNSLLGLFKLPELPAAGNNPTTSNTTTTTTPTGSTSTTSTRDTSSYQSNGATPSSTANATAQSTADKPNDSQSSTGGVDVTVPKVTIP